MSWSRLVKWLRISAAVWAGGVPVVLVLQAIKVVPALPKLETAAWIISLVIIGVDNVGTLFSRSRNARRRTRDDEIGKALMSLLIDLARNSTVRFEELGASIHVVSRRDRIRGRSANPARLVRIERFRPSGYPSESGVHWTPAKGAVGEAWTKRKAIYRNWSAVGKKWDGVDISEERWAKIPKDTKDGFDRGDFMAIVGKYSEVLAEPIWHPDGGRLVGILSIDRAFSAVEVSFKPELDAQGTRQIATATASVVGNILIPKKNEEG
jgi:hypothetical protein